MKIHHIKLLFCIFGLFVLQTTCEAKSQPSEVLSKIEKSLFNMDYSKQSEDVRLKRIEENVYGVASTKAVSLRIEKLSKDLAANLIGQEIKPKKDSFLNDDEIITTKSNEDMNYALVNNLERKVFKYEFKNVDIIYRLSALEGQVFKDNYSVDDLSTRISRLQNAVMYNKFPSKDISIAQLPIPQQKIFTMENLKEKKLIPIPNSIDKQEQILNPKIKLISLEMSILKNSFPSEKTSDRLAKLESKVFNSTFLDDDEQTRLNRIEGACKATGSLKKYSGNRASQRTATAIQMGTILLMILPFLL